MDSKNSRRTFLKKGGLVAVGFMGLYQLVQPIAKAGILTMGKGYGELIPDPEGILNLPKGFSYKIISKTGQVMNDGFLVPGNPDGMGTFPGKNGRIIIIRNHELGADSFDEGPFGEGNKLYDKVAKQSLYDQGKGTLPGLGGTTTLIYNPATGEVENEFLSLSGTLRNCAGGITPWGTWITCEESTLNAGDLEGNLEKDHGYVFEVPASETMRLSHAKPIKEMGRFNHEAVAVDPKTSIVYLTEDRGDGLFYRFIPSVPGKLHKGGKLQALAIKGQKSRDTRNWKDLTDPKFPINKSIDVEWIDLDVIDAPKDDLRHRGFEAGAAVFARGEGIWFGEGELYFACTNGGEISSGQIFKYTPGAKEGKKAEASAPGKLELFAEPNDVEILKNCDNLAIAPWGDLILCEDDKHPFVVGVSPAGEYYKIAENVGYPSEFAGGVFSPDGEIYFVNIQSAGLTVAITGPWANKG